MVDEALHEFDAQLEHGSSGFLKSYVRAACAEESQEATAAIIAATALEPDALVLLRERMAKWAAEAARHAADPVLAATVMMAADGVWYANMLNVNERSARERAEVATRLVQMADEATSE